MAHHCFLNMFPVLLNHGERAGGCQRREGDMSILLIRRVGFAKNHRQERAQSFTQPAEFRDAGEQK